MRDQVRQKRAVTDILLRVDAWQVRDAESGKDLVHYRARNVHFESRPALPGFVQRNIVGEGGAGELLPCQNSDNSLARLDVVGEQALANCFALRCAPIRLFEQRQQESLRSAG